MGNSYHHGLGHKINALGGVQVPPCEYLSVDGDLSG